jgi:hypothetical protein
LKGAFAAVDGKGNCNRGFAFPFKNLCYVLGAVSLGIGGDKRNHLAIEIGRVVLVLPT